MVEGLSKCMKQQEKGDEGKGEKKWWTEWRGRRGGKLSRYKEQRGETDKVWRCFNKRFPVEKHSLSPFPPHYPSPGQRGGRLRRVERKMTFSFVHLRVPYYHLSLETCSFFLSPILFSLLLNNRLTEDFFLYFLSPCFHCLSLFPSLVLSPFYTVIAWLINYKGIRKNEKRLWHFNLQREISPAPTQTH